jgi:hypothetical protein
MLKDILGATLLHSAVKRDGTEAIALAKQAREESVSSRRNVLEIKTSRANVPAERKPKNLPAGAKRLFPDCIAMQTEILDTHCNLVFPLSPLSPFLFPFPTYGNSAYTISPSTLALAHVKTRSSPRVPVL